MEQSLSTTPLLPLDKSTAHSVEIVREEGENGELESFGFTIKNGRPPVISSIVPGGPADRVGLKSNNVILSVNGEAVDYLSHQTVADLIYKSPSSSVWLMVSESPEESVHHTSALHSYSPKMSHRYSVNSSTARSKSQQRYAASVFARRSPSFTSRGVCKKIDVFLHYLGPVEMPYRWVARGVSLKCIRECVKKMLVTRRQHLAVVLEVAPDEMSLLSTQNKKLISYSRDELYYCGVHMEDERYFGFVTRHQKIMVDPQVGQTVSDKEGEETTDWINHCHVFQVVPGQSSITMTFQQVSSPLKRETTTPVRSANTIVNYIRQMYGSGNHHSADNGALVSHTPPVTKPTPIQHVIPNIAKVSSGSSMSSSTESSPNVQRRYKDLVDLRPPAEGSEATNSPVLADSPYSPSTFSFSGSSQHDDHDSHSQPSSVRGETGLENIESEPNLHPQVVVTEVEEPKVNGIHDDFVRNGLPPKNSKISGSLDSVMTSTTTADNTFDNAPQVGSWVASFDKLLQDPAGVQCFQQFLLGEFSDENIKFWLEIEKYKVKHPHQLKPAAKRIYSVYVSPDAKQPVNLDGSTVKSIQDRLESPNAATFNEAQKQIYNLMRLDSYQRFKRSSLLQKCLLAEMDSQPLPISLPQDTDQDTSEDRDKVTPLQPVKVAEEKQQSKKSGRDGWSLFNRRTNSFRNNTKQKSSFGSYFTQEKKSSKVVRDKSKGSGIARVEPEPRAQEAFKGFQGHEEEDHLDLFNDKYGPCFGIVIQEKVSKILPVPSSGTVQDALHSVVVKQNKMSFSTLDIRYADTMQLVDLEDPASVLNRHYIVVKQSLEFFHAIFPGKEVPVPADQNKTVLEVMKPILADNSLDESMVAFYMYGARQPLSNTTYAGLLKGRKIHVKLLPKPGVSSSLTRNSLGTRGSNHSLHSSSSSLNQKSDTVSSNVSDNNNNNNNNNNNSSKNADKDDLFDMIMRLQSDTLDEQRSRPVARPLSSSVSAFVIKESKNERERTPSDPPSSPKKSQSIVKPIKRMFRTLSGSEPSLNKVELVGRRSLSPAPDMSLSQDVVDDVPKFTVEVVSQFHPSRRRSYASPPTASPPARDTWIHARSVSPPPTHPRYQPPPQYKHYSSTARPISPTVQPQMVTRPKSPTTTQPVDEFRVRAGSIQTRMGGGRRETTPTSGYRSKSQTPDSLVEHSNTSSLDRVILTANTHQLRRDRRNSKESSSSSDGTYISFHQNSSRYRPHRPLHQYNSEPGFSLSQPQDMVQNWPPAYRSPVHSGATDEERKLLAKGEHLLEKEFQEYQSSMTQPSLSQPTHDYPLQRGHPSRKRIPKQSSKQWNKAGSMV